MGDVGEGAVNVRYVGLALQSSAIEEKGKKKEKEKEKDKDVKRQNVGLALQSGGLSCQGLTSGCDAW